MKNSQFPVARKTGLVVQEMPEEVLVYDLETNKAHCLNDTASMVWKACDGRSSVEDIARTLGHASNTEVSDDLVWLAIDQLNTKNLLERPFEQTFKGQSRREAIKKIGLASMIALPVVASLVAPQSALANQSCDCSVTACGVFPCPSGACNVTVCQ